MEDKTISKEQIEILFKAALLDFRLWQDFAQKFPEAEPNPFLGEFAGYRMAIDILGLSAEYLAYVAKNGDGND